MVTPTHTGSNKLADIFLIVQAREDDIDSTTPIIHLNGRDWTVEEASRLQHLDSSNGFICVSYIWSTNRMRNPTNLGPAEISTNTLPALLAAMQSTDITAFWIDAFCVPTTQPARSATLESMGYIYSQAKEIRAVLSETSFQAIAQLSASDSLDEEAMITLEKDMWIKSVWTYQEVVNCNQLSLVCSGALGQIVDGTDFLNGLGYSISKYKKHHQIDSPDFRRIFPALDAIEDLLADWMVSGPVQRSALAVMSGMNGRIWTEEKNYFYAMIGAVSTKPRSRSIVIQKHLAEIFMEICEEKGDFSFIYSSAARSTRPTQTWRPEIGILPSILPWHSWGTSQPGHFDSSGSLWLDEVVMCQPAFLSQEAKDFHAQYLSQPDLAQDGDWMIRNAIFPSLVKMSFTGSDQAVPLEYGFFFPQTSLPSNAGDLKIIVSCTIRWAAGAAAIASCKDEAGNAIFLPGVLTGVVHSSDASTVKLA